MTDTTKLAERIEALEYLTLVLHVCDEVCRKYGVEFDLPDQQRLQSARKCEQALRAQEAHNG